MILTLVPTHKILKVWSLFSNLLRLQKKEACQEWCNLAIWLGVDQKTGNKELQKLNLFLMVLELKMLNKERWETAGLWER